MRGVEILAFTLALAVVFFMYRRKQTELALYATPALQLFLWASRRASGQPTTPNGSWLAEPVLVGAVAATYRLTPERQFWTAVALFPVGAILDVLSVVVWKHGAVFTFVWLGATAARQD